MAETTIYLYNLGLIIAIITLFIYQISKFDKSTKPVIEQFVNPTEPISGKRDSLGESIKTDIKKKYTEDEFQQILKTEKNRYNKERNIYLTTYFIPIIFTILSFISLIDLVIGLIFLILSFISTVISRIITKFFNIGVKIQ